MTILFLLVTGVCQSLNELGVVSVPKKWSGQNWTSRTACYGPEYFTVSSGQPEPFIEPLRWGLILHCCSALLQNLVGNSGETQCLEEAEQQTEASVDVPYPPLQIVNSVNFSLFSLSLSSLCSLSQSSLFSLHHPFFLF